MGKGHSIEKSSPGCMLSFLVSTGCSSLYNLHGWQVTEANRPRRHGAQQHRHAQGCGIAWLQVLWLQHSMQESHGLIPEDTARTAFSEL